MHNHLMIITLRRCAGLLIRAYGWKFSVEPQHILTRFVCCFLHLNDLIITLHLHFTYIFVVHSFIPQIGYTFTF